LGVVFVFQLQKIYPTGFTDAQAKDFLREAIPKPVNPVDPV
jgi:hypothetical protein